MTESTVGVIEEADRHLRQDDGVAAAKVVAQTPIDDLMALDLADLRALMARIGGAADQVPNAVLSYAYVLELSLHRDERTDLLTQLAKDAANTNNDRLLRAVLAEQARDHVRNWEIEDAERLANQVLRGVDGASEARTRTRALAALGAAHAYRREPGDVSRAAELLRESAALARQLRERTWEAHALSWLGYATLYPEGDDAEAIAAHERALEVAVPGSRLVSLTRNSLAAVLLAAGRLDEAVPHLQAMEDEARAAGDARGLAWAAWTWARHAALRNDPVVLSTRLDEVERRRTDWFDDSEGLKFLAEASELAQSVGEEAMGRRFLERAEERARMDDLEHIVRPARAAYEARFGDPRLAEELLETIPSFPAALRRDRWLIEVLRAIAADRRGDETRARQLAAAALEQANTIGLAHLLLLREPVLAPRVIALAVAGGSRTGHQLASVRPPEVRVSLFGRFRVEVRGTDRTPTGQPATLVKMVALAGGTATVDQVIDWFWPDEDRDVGKRRVRNLLNRLRSMSGEVVIREKELLRIPDASIDLTTVESALNRLDDWAPDAPDSVREVWKLVVGPLLADDPYEEWAIQARDRTSLRLAGAADRMASDAQLRSDDQEAAVWLERGIQQQLLDPGRHEALVETVARTHDRSRLALVATRARDTYRELDIPVPPSISSYLPT